jgi:predicted membrane-bound mannosyltransferase
MYYLPTVVSATLVLVIGAVLAGLVRKYVKAGVQALGLNSAGLVSTVGYYAVWLFTLFAALTQLGLASSAVQIVLIGLIVAIALALGISFGLGGKNLAEKTLEKVSDNLKK